MTLGQPGLVEFTDATSSCLPLGLMSMRGEKAQYREGLLQQLIAESPWLLPVKDFLPTTTSVLSLGREIAVDLGGQTGYIDNLLVTNEGRFVLVETKLWRNPESTREVIAQILQYGMALSALGLAQFDAKVQLPTGCRTTADAVASLAGSGAQIDDLEEVMERHLRRGELLYLIVSDGIRHSVERITHWLNDAGSAPFKFGLVELRFFQLDAGRAVVIPRTLLRTREASRHVVVVDVQGPLAEYATATVKDQSKTVSGAKTLTQRNVKLSGPSMTKDRLLVELRSREGGVDAAVAERIVECLDSLGMDGRSTPTSLQFGLSSAGDDSAFHPLISLGLGSAWSHPNAPLINAIGDEQFVQHKLRMNAVGPFYRPEQASDPTKRGNELEVPFRMLDGKEETLGAAIFKTANLAREMLSE